MQNTYLWDISQKLIGFDTVSSKSNLACAQVVADELQRLGFEVILDQSNIKGEAKAQVLASIGPQTADGLMLSGHLDVVPFERQPGWTREPLVLTLANEKIYARGSSDMKLFIAHCLDAFRSFDFKRLKKPLVCLFTADEEVGCLGAKRICPELQSLLLDMPLPSRCVIGEPTEFQVFPIHKGVVSFQLRVSGKAGHSSRPDLGKNAILALGSVIGLIEEMNEAYKKQRHASSEQYFPDFPFNYLHLAQVNGGLAPNMIPESCVMAFSYRSLPHEADLLLLEDFRDRLASLNIGDYVIENITNVPSMSLAHNHVLEACLTEFSPQTASELKGAHFATDGAFISKLGIDTYICGPGSIDMAHQPNEFMTEQDFRHGSRFVSELLRKLLC